MSWWDKKLTPRLASPVQPVGAVHQFQSHRARLHIEPIGESEVEVVVRPCHETLVLANATARNCSLRTSLRRFLQHLRFAPPLAAVSVRFVCVQYLLGLRPVDEVFALATRDSTAGTLRSRMHCRSGIHDVATDAPVEKCGFVSVGPA